MNIQTAQYVSYMGQNISVKVTEDNDNILWVPIDTANTDYQAIQEWAKIDGNSITAAD